LLYTIHVMLIAWCMQHELLISSNAGKNSKRGRDCCLFVTRSTARDRTT
jgi:hypothetical protein